MTYITKEHLARPAEVKDVEITGLGTARISELTRSRRMKFDAWLRPDGELDPDRDKLRDLKLCVLCLVDANDQLLFDFDDDQFLEFATELEDKAANPWIEVAYEVMKVNGYIVEEEEANGLLEK